MCNEQTGTTSEAAWSHRSAGDNAVRLAPASNAPHRKFTTVMKGHCESCSPPTNTTLMGRETQMIWLICNSGITVLGNIYTHVLVKMTQCVYLCVHTHCCLLGRGCLHHWTCSAARCHWHWWQVPARSRCWRSKGWKAPSMTHVYKMEQREKQIRFWSHIHKANLGHGWMGLKYLLGLNETLD